MSLVLVDLQKCPFMGCKIKNMLAVIKTGGKQYIVSPGDKIKIEKLEEKEGKEVTFTDVLLVEENDKVEVGNPVLKTTVKGKVISHGKGKKIIVFKYKPKKRYQRKLGHRQQFTEIEITKIGK